MGEATTRRHFTEADFERYRLRVAEELQQLTDMLENWNFDTSSPRAGMEVELSLVHPDGRPACIAPEVLKVVNDPLFVPELGKFNIELNLPPRQLGPTGLTAFSETMRSTLNDAVSRAAGLGVRLAAVGILPTLRIDDLVADALSDEVRYQVLDETIRAARQAPVAIDITGAASGATEAESLAWEVDTIIPEAACTSHQVHLQVSPEAFAGYWNASQAVAGVQLAMGANSPFLGGRRLHAETRVALFSQATDTRTYAERAAGKPARVFFGDDWIDSVLDLFRDNSARFRPLLPDLPEEAPDDDVPRLAALTLLNGTVYRWNRPVYDVSGGAPHLRVENRVLPSGPTAVDMVANAAWYAGLTRALAEQEHPAFRDASHAVAQANFVAGARDGIDARLFWPGTGEVSARKLVLEVLLGHAAAGLEAFGVSGEEISRYLGIIERRAALGINGASWQTAAVAAREAAGEDRETALAGMLDDYLEQAREGRPIHEWES